VLHGHRHHPTYFSINYNRVGPERAMTVLGAGTATKNIHGFDGSRGETQVHLVELYSRTMIVYWYRYDYRINDFYLSRRIPYERVRSEITERKIHYSYKARGDAWNMAVEEQLYLAAAPGTSLPEIPIELAVDDNTPECLDFGRLNVRLWQDEKSLAEDSYVIKRNDPREKIIAVRLPNRASVANIRCSYEWPAGFHNLGKNGKDIGSFPMETNIDELRVELEIQAPLKQIRDSPLRIRRENAGSRSTDQLTRGRLNSRCGRNKLSAQIEASGSTGSEGRNGPNA
jgi:hypothetical protein